MSYDGQGMTYDYSGNLTECGTRSFGWTEHNQLSVAVEWYRNEDNELTKRRIDYTYDTSGIRTSKTVDGVRTDYFYVGDKLVRQTTGDEYIKTLYFTYSADGSPFSIYYRADTFYYLLNLQGDVIGIYNRNGEIVVSYVYDSWGKLISISGSLADTLGVLNPLRYRGYYYDNETQLYYLQSRYYNPEWGRFISADSLLVAGDYLQGINRFAYCFNNPICYSDPSGYSIEDAIYIITGMLGGLLYLSGCVPTVVLNGYVNSMLGHNFQSGKEMTDYILTIVEAFMPPDGWSIEYPYPTTITNVGFQVIMDGRFLGKNYCLEYARLIIDNFGNGERFYGMDEERIAIELYGHAFIHFLLPIVKESSIYNDHSDVIDDIYNSSDPIDVNYNESPERMLGFSFIWFFL